jgi:hypothetical protein
MARKNLVYRVERKATPTPAEAELLRIVPGFHVKTLGRALLLSNLRRWFPKDQITDDGKTITIGDRFTVVTVEL